MSDRSEAAKRLMAGMQEYILLTPGVSGLIDAACREAYEQCTADVLAKLADREAFFRKHGETRVAEMIALVSGEIQAEHHIGAAEKSDGVNQENTP